MISQTLKKLRENNGYTQQQVANALGIERSTYTYYETGKTTPDINTIIKLAKIFNISCTEMLENEKKESSRALSDSCDDLYGCYDSKDFCYIYELSKKEKTLISLYRILSTDAQDKLLKKIKKDVDKNKKNDEILQESDSKETF